MSLLDKKKLSGTKKGIFTRHVKSCENQLDLWKRDPEGKYYKKGLESCLRKLDLTMKSQCKCMIPYNVNEQMVFKAAMGIERAFARNMTAKENTVAYVWKDPLIEEIITQARQDEEYKQVADLVKMR